MNKYAALILLFFLALGLSAIGPHDYFTWFLEVLPALVGLAILVATFRRFRFTYFVYVLIFLKALILVLGGHYTYAEVPLGYWVQELFGQSRNNYDKLGHFAQGFVPAAIVREVLFRKKVVIARGWLGFLTLSVCMLISVGYEFLEWGVAVGTGESAEAFLGTQGYAWDTQADMLFAAIGGSCFLLFFSRYHDRQMSEMVSREPV